MSPFNLFNLCSSNSIVHQSIVDILSPIMWGVTSTAFLTDSGTFDCILGGCGGGYCCWCKVGDGGAGDLGTYGYAYVWDWGGTDDVCCDWGKVPKVLSVQLQY